MNQTLSMKPNNTEAAESLTGQNPAWLGLVQKQVASLRFGIVQIVVHDSRVVQIERTEKLRIDQPES